ncbi:nicotinate (nicotinamide) nucleotide adenylyltransferase [Hydrogenophaga sp. 5NK40-0174]|uniref:nicotinate (nicotinamide) nucleotide adenylyltransferase n=1 Tax=Hydrogenophaga sp. 5NK40-0174 TaxID=3127649 RepID=UPI00310A39AE
MTTASSRPDIRRVGMFGGAFDPPHLAHRSLAESALAQLNLDLLLVLPTGQAWHKARTLTEADHRLAMSLLAFGDLPNTRVDPRETRREGATYTADTLGELAREYPGAQLFLVLGADQLLAFKTWMRWQDVMSKATLAVANRAVHIGVDAVSEGHPMTDLSGVDLPFVQLDMPPTNVSATAVRARFSRPVGPHSAHEALVQPAVADYISQHHLYQTHT